MDVPLEMVQRLSREIERCVSTRGTPRETQFVSEYTDWAAQTGRTFARDDRGVAEISKRRARTTPPVKNLKKQ